ncbi:MAG: stage IV sporulation protein A [Clostridia bacterium]|nr:stage IV sporulation protein A [Oscillospiraceae bacterium]MBQ6702146.1 stage IV sporulation protein A [Clostridia bacterium]
MTDTAIYKDISARTGGDIYIGVVGPVRTGKSTFIRKFMENIVLPNITEEYEEKRARDEMPQSAAGKTVMTTEPKFVPDEAVSVTLNGNATMKVKMVDCVGYIVPEALGHIENGSPRMVMTPWSESPMPFGEAAELGTRKVINDHSTIGVLVTTDGSVGEFGRDAYVEAEERVAEELHKINKPFVIVLNSSKPESDESERLAYELEEKYGAPVALVNCLELDKEDIESILEMVLLEFPVKEIRVKMPGWIYALDDGQRIRKSITEQVLSSAEEVMKAGDIKKSFDALGDNEYVVSSAVTNIDLGSGKAELTVELKDDLFYKTVGEMTELDIEDEEDLISQMLHLAKIKKEYERVEEALADVEEKGYGIVTPRLEDLKLEEPEITKQQGAYGVKLKASAPSIHMIKANIQTELNPIVGTEQQSEELIKFMLREFEEDPTRIWESNMFGTSLYELINEGLNSKLAQIPHEARLKLGDTLQKLINEGSGGLLCIIL